MQSLSTARSKYEPCGCSRRRVVHSGIRIRSRSRRRGSSARCRFTGQHPPRTGGCCRSSGAGGPPWQHRVGRPYGTAAAADCARRRKHKCRSRTRGELWYADLFFFFLVPRAASSVRRNGAISTSGSDKSIGIAAIKFRIEFESINVGFTNTRSATGSSSSTDATAAVAVHQSQTAQQMHRRASVSIPSDEALALDPKHLRVLRIRKMAAAWPFAFGGTAIVRGFFRPRVRAAIDLDWRSAVAVAVARPRRREHWFSRMHAVFFWYCTLERRREGKEGKRKERREYKLTCNT